MYRFNLKRIQVTLHHLLKVVLQRKHEKCSKLILAFHDRCVVEGKFKTSSGVSGYIARAKNLKFQYHVQIQPKKNSSHLPPPFEKWFCYHVNMKNVQSSFSNFRIVTSTKQNSKPAVASVVTLPEPKILWIRENSTQKQ